MKTADLIALVVVGAAGVAATIYFTSGARATAQAYAAGNTNASPPVVPVSPAPAPVTRYADGNSTGAVLDGVAGIANSVTGVLGMFNKWFP